MKKFLLLFFLFAAMYLIPLGGRPMVVPDEFRYGQIPWEMLEFGNFAAPQMFGHPYFEKPVLGHWLGIWKAGVLTHPKTLPNQLASFTLR